MIEFLVGNIIVDQINKRKHREHFNEDIVLNTFNNKQFIAGLIVSLIIAFITAYIAYQCNYNENGPVKFIITLFAFFFSGFYLIYYFIVYVIFDAKCSGTNDFVTLDSIKKIGNKIKGNKKKKQKKK